MAVQARKVEEIRAWLSKRLRLSVEAAPLYNREAILLCAHVAPGEVVELELPASLLDASSSGEIVAALEEEELPARMLRDTTIRYRTSRRRAERRFPSSPRSS